MTTTVLAPAQWAQMEFSLVELGDQRRTERLVKIATRLAENPGGTLPQAMPHWSELKAAYRFFSQPRNGYEQILKPHWERTQQACLEPGEYLLIEDTTQLNYTRHGCTEHLGLVGEKDRGLCLHSTLALRVSAWDLNQRPEVTVVGLLAQQCWAQKRRPLGETRAERNQRSGRMSKRWAELLATSPGPGVGNTWTYVADRESDVYEALQRCQQRQVDFVIRACQNRGLADASGCLWDRLDQAQRLGQNEVELRARPGMAARRTVVELRSTRVRLSAPKRSGFHLADLEEVSLLEVREISPETGIEPLRWVLLSSLPCTSLVQAQRIVGCYAARWHVEEYHKALKSGAGVEASQLATAERLAALIAVLALVAVRLLNTKLLARTWPDQPLANDLATNTALNILEAKLGKPAAGWTQSTFWIAVARLGGFIGRKHDGEPGWQTIWRGWHRLLWMTEGLEIQNQPFSKCG